MVCKWRETNTPRVHGAYAEGRRVHLATSRELNPEGQTNSLAYQWIKCLTMVVMRREKGELRVVSPVEAELYLRRQRRRGMRRL